MKTLKLVIIDMYIQTKIYLYCAVLAYENVEQSSTDCSAELKKNIRMQK